MSSSPCRRSPTPSQPGELTFPVLGCHLASIPRALRHPLGIAGCLPTPACPSGLDPATCSRNPLRCSFLAEQMLLVCRLTVSVQLLTFSLLSSFSPEVATGGC